ncbi:MAG: hypothetical protein AB7O26_18495 [Planctomycetaceae bacterium]
MSTLTTLTTKNPQIPCIDSEIDKSAIADLSFAQMQILSDEALVAVIRNSELPLPALQHRQLHFMNRDELERIAYLARRCCRLQGY